MIEIMVVYFLFQEIPCRELSQLGKGKIIFKSYLVGDNYLSGKDWKPLAETISPLQATPFATNRPGVFSKNKTCFKMTGNHTETKAGFKKVNHFECCSSINQRVFFRFLPPKYPSHFFQRTESECRHSASAPNTKRLHLGES